MGEQQVKEHRPGLYGYRIRLGAPLHRAPLPLPDKFTEK
jgi:hypothetical protein